MMKETRISTTIEGVSMRRTALVVALAAIFVFAFAASAFAAKGSSVPSGNRGNVVTGTAAVYIPWSSVATWGANPPATSPHGGYATTTAKCQVCHAVHYAAPQGDTLLRMKASDACVYCHVSTDFGIPGKLVYGGSVTIATSSGDDHHTIGTSCYICHASVHGSNAINDVPSLMGLLLRNDDASATAGYNFNPRTIAARIDSYNATDAVTGYTATEYGTLSGAAVRSAAIGVFCSGCHEGSYSNAKPGTARVGASYFRGTTATGALRGDNVGRYTGHRVGAHVTATTNWNSTGAISTGLQTIGQIAWADATRCTSCHDADNGFGTGPGFPHYTPNRSRFMNQAAYAGAAVSTTQTVGWSADPAGIRVAPSATNSHLYYSTQDGTCIKCHIGSGGNSGVGKTY